MRQKKINEKKEKVKGDNQMSTRPKPVLPDKDVQKELLKKGPAVENRVYVRAGEKVERMKKEGWKVVDEDKGKHGRTVGVRTHASDLVLMEK